MKIWTYGEAKTKILTDLDLQDESFVSPNELVGYFNEGLTEAESEITELNKDYLKTKYYVPFVIGTSLYDLPDNIFANKIRKFVYWNATLIYEIVPYKREHMFEEIAMTDQFGAADDYRYQLVNHMPGQAQLEVHPVLRETAILPPQASPFYPGILWYIRNCARIPLVAVGANPAELCNPEVIAPTQVNTSTNVITVNSGTRTYGQKSIGQVGCFPGSIAYITGDIVRFKAAPGGTLPSPLLADTNYYVIALTATTIKVATTLANAVAGTAIPLTTQGTVFHTIYVAATQAIVNATLIDIPEFSTFVIQWAKCRCMEKEVGHPGLDAAAATLTQQKKQMVDTLTNAVPDDNDLIPPDYSSYQEHS